MNTLSGVIASGKSSLTQLLSNELGTKPFYEPVEDNPVLPLFYEGNRQVEAGEATTNPYAFLLQIFYLNRRFSMIKQAMQEDNNILDRSIFEDAIFMKMNYEQGHTTEEEWNIYQDLLENMMEELPYAAHKKSPDLMIMIHVSYETMIHRIFKRGREFEQLENDPSLATYYKDLIARYDDWMNEFDICPMIVIDGDKYDFMENESDRNHVLNQIEQKLVDLGKLSQSEFDAIKSRRERGLPF